MEYSKQDTSRIKGFAILLMVVLHLFDRLDYQGLFTPLVFIAEKPAVYYLGLISDCCVALFVMCTGYAQAITQNSQNAGGSGKKNLFRIGKLLIGYWVILLLFGLVCLVSGNAETLGSVWLYIKHIFLLSKDYNGAWWYLMTYAIITLVSPLLNKAAEKVNTVIVIGISALLYVVTHFLKLREGLYAAPVLGWLFLQLVLFIGLMFSYFCGYYFAKYKLITVIRKQADKFPRALRVIFVISVFTVMTVLHALVPSSVVGAGVAVVVFALFAVGGAGKPIYVFLDFMGEHSMNIWLIHMFFYIEKYGALVYKLKYPILILIGTLVASIAASYLIKLICKPIYRQYDKLLRKG